jgi:hypothetical protein
MWGLPVCIVAHFAKMCTLKSNKGIHQRKEKLGIRIPYLVCVPPPPMESCRVVGLLGYFIGERRHTFFFEVVGMMAHLPCYLIVSGGFDTVGTWTRSPLAVSEALHGLGGKKAEVPSTPRINPGVGSEPSLWFSCTV